MFDSIALTISRAIPMFLNVQFAKFFDTTPRQPPYDDPIMSHSLHTLISRRIEYIYCIHFVALATGLIFVRFITAF